MMASFHREAARTAVLTQTPMGFRAKKEQYNPAGFPVQFVKRIAFCGLSSFCESGGPPFEPRPCVSLADKD